MNDQQLYEAASRRADDKLGFYIHLAVYTVMNGILAAINLLFFPSARWYQFSLLAWGMCLIIHGLIVFVVNGMNLKERLLRAELRRMRESPELIDLSARPPRQANEQRDPAHGHT